MAGRRFVVSAMAAVLLLPTGCTSSANPTESACQSSALPDQDPTRPIYVALGDSYSAGEGAPLAQACAGQDFLPGTEKAGGITGSTGCHRSVEAWPVLVWQGLNPTYQLSFHACSGAVINDYYAPHAGQDAQSVWLTGPPNPSVKLVTFTFGGNDADFATTMNSCVNRLDNLFDSCLAALSVPTAKIDDLAGPPGSWPGHHTLSEFYGDIRHAAPDARVLVVGYPRLFPEAPPRGGCGGGAGRNISENEMLGLDQTADEADRVIRRAALAAGFEYVDVSDVLQDHSVCSQNDAWINRALPHNVQQSFHPNVAGQRAIAARVLECAQSNSCPGGTTNAGSVKRLSAATLPSAVATCGSFAQRSMNVGRQGNDALLDLLNWRNYSPEPRADLNADLSGLPASTPDDRSTIATLRADNDTIGAARVALDQAVAQHMPHDPTVPVYLSDPAVTSLYQAVRRAYVTAGSDFLAAGLPSCATPLVTEPGAIEDMYAFVDAACSPVHVEGHVVLDGNVDTLLSK
jgi:hypothetical protein